MQPAAVLSVLVVANTKQAQAGLMRFQGQLRTTEGRAASLGNTMKSALKVGAFGAGAALGYSVKKAADFEQQLDSLGSVSAASGREMEKFRKQAMKAGADTKFSALDAAVAQTELAKGGLSVRNIMRGGLRSALALAAAGEMDLGEAAATTANALNLFGLEGKSSMKVADALAKAANATTADVTDFAMALRQSGGVAKTAGLSFTETVLALEALANAGTKNSDAGTSLKAALLQLIGPTAKQRELQEKLGLEFINSEGSMKSMSQISTMLRGSLGKMGDAQRAATLKVLAGTDGVRTLTALYDAGPEKLDKWRTGLQKSGTAAEVAARKQDNLKGKLENLQGSVETIAIAFGSKLLPALTAAAKKITDLLNDPKLTASEKLDKFAEMFGEAVADAGPVVAKAAAKVGVAAVRGFFTAFRESPLWFKLLTAGFVLAKLGAFTGFKRAGVQAGAAFGAGVGDGSAAALAAAGATARKGANASAVAAASRGGRLVHGKQFRSGMPQSQLGAQAFGLSRVSQGVAAQAKKIAPQVRNIGKNVLGFALVAGIADAATRQGLKGFGDRFQQAASSASLGLLPAPNTVDERLAEIAGKIRKWRGDGSLKLSDPSDPDNSLIRAEDLNDFTGRQRKMLMGLAKLRNTATEFFGKDFKFTPKMEINPEAAVKKLRMLANEFGRMKSGAILSVKELRQTLAGQFQRIADTMGTGSAQGQKEIAKNFRAAVGNIVDFKQRGVLNASQAGKQIAFLMKHNTGKGQKAVAENMLAAQKAIARTMRRGGEITAEGTALIRLLMVNAMKNMGLSPDTIRMSVNKRESAKKGPVTPGQTGLVVTGGKPAGDSVHALLERGEVVINRKAVQKMGGPQAVNKINQQIPRFQSGGVAGMVPKGGFPDAMGARPGLDALAWVLQKKFGIGVTSGLRPGAITTSGNLSDHGFGTAIDVSNGGSPTPQMDAAHAFLRKALGAGGGWVENYSGGGIKQMLYRTMIGGNHFNHIHVALTEALANSAQSVMRAVKSGGLAGLGIAPKVPGVSVEGPDSMVKTLVQGALDNVRQGANAKLKKLGEAAAFTGSGGGGTDAFVAPGGTYKGPLNRDFGANSPVAIGFNQAAMLAEKAGLPGVTYAQIAIGESALRPGAVSSDGGYGLWQMTPRVQSAQTVAAWEKIGSYFNPWNNARQAKHLAGSGTGTSNYFGTGSVTDWNKHYTGPMKGLQEGGIVGMQEGGAVDGFKGAQPTRKFFKSVWNQTKKLGGRGFEEKMPAIIRNLPPRALTFGGKRNFAQFISDGRQVQLPAGFGQALQGKQNDLYADMVGADGTPIDSRAFEMSHALKVLVHEYAHSAQPLSKMKKWEREGGAESFAQWASPKVYKALGIPYMGAPTSYTNFVAQVEKEKSQDWIRHGQFVGRNKLAKGGMVGYAGDSLGVGTIGPLRALLDRKVEGHPSSGKSSSWGVGQLVKGAAQHVFDFGTNDATGSAIRSSINTVDRKTGKKPVHVMTVNGTPPGGQSAALKNKAIRAAAGGDVRLVDWAAKHKGRLDSLGHGAYPERARLIAASIRRAKETEAKVDPKFRKIKRTASVGRLLQNTLKGVRGGVGGKELKKRLALLGRKIKNKNLGLPTGLKKQIAELSAGATLFGERADNAGKLSVDNEDGTSQPGVFAGKSEAGWVQAQVDAMFKLRNKLVQATEEIAKRRAALAKLIKRIQKRIAEIKRQVEAAAKAKTKVEKALAKAQKDKPKDKPKIKKLKEMVKEIDGKQRDRGKEKKVLSGKVLPLFATQDKALLNFRNSGDGGVMPALSELQGSSGPMTRFTSMPAINVLGGTILDARLRLQDLLAPAKPVTDASDSTPSDTSELLRQLLREANQRTAVSQRQYDIFKNFDATSGALQQFATGGIVQAPMGAPLPVIAHGGEGVFTRDQMAAMGGSGGDVKVTLHFPPGMDFLRDKIRVEVENVTRRQARTAGRGLPGRGGGG